MKQLAENRYRYTREVEKKADRRLEVIDKKVSMRARMARMQLYWDLCYLVWAQALEDPFLRPMVLEYFETNLAQVAKGTERYVPKDELGNLPKDYSAQDIAERVSTMEPKFQLYYHHRIDQLNVSVTELEAFEAKISSNLVGRLLIGYMANRNHRWSRRTNGFSLRSP